MVLREEMDEDAVLQRLKDIIEKFFAWTEESEAPNKYGFPYHAYSFGEWKELSETFLQFLTKFPADQWTEQHLNLATEVARIDWAHQSLLADVEGKQLEALLTQSYSDQYFAMYMLMRARQIKDEDVRKRMALHYFENTNSEAVRDTAFEMLVKVKWERTSEYAARLWESGPSETQMAILGALLHGKSDQFEYYLNLGMNSSDNGLRNCAKAMNRIKYLYGFEKITPE